MAFNFERWCKLNNLHEKSVDILQVKNFATKRFDGTDNSDDKQTEYF